VKSKKFNPSVNKIELNPEQAVLECSCYLDRYMFRDLQYSPGAGWITTCYAGRISGTVPPCTSSTNLGQGMGHTGTLTAASS